MRERPGYKPYMDRGGYAHLKGAVRPHGEAAMDEIMFIVQRDGERRISDFNDLNRAY